jgi:anti-sigma B factor antagonist
METAIGVFSSRERAEQAVRELLDQKVPEKSIVFVTRSEAEAKTIGKQMGATVGGFLGAATGASAGVIAATLLVVPGIGQVFALGFGAAALMGLVGAGAGSKLGGAVIADSSAPQPTPDERSSDDVDFFRDVLKSGRSLIVVRTQSADTLRIASRVLDRLGLGILGGTPMRMQATTRQIKDIAIVNISGRITVGEGNVMLRDLVRELIEKGSNKILLDLHEVGYVDSSGIGELVKTYTTVHTHGGQLKLVSPSKRVQDLLQMTRLASIFDVQADEATAVQSFGSSQPSRGVA